MKKTRKIRILDLWDSGSAPFKYAPDHRNRLDEPTDF